MYKIGGSKSRITEMICCEPTFRGQVIRKLSVLEGPWPLIPEEEGTVEGEPALTASLTVKEPG